MTQFTEAFYKVYYETKHDLEIAKQEWNPLTTGFRLDSAALLRMISAHEQQVELYERLVQLEKLWGVYCVNYTIDANTKADRTYVEAECLKELNIIMELEDGTT